MSGHLGDYPRQARAASRAARCTTRRSGASTIATRSSGSGRVCRSASGASMLPIGVKARRSRSRRCRARAEQLLDGPRRLSTYRVRLRRRRRLQADEVLVQARSSRLRRSVGCCQATSVTIRSSTTSSARATTTRGSTRSTRAKSATHFRPKNSVRGTSARAAQLSRRVRKSQQISGNRPCRCTAIAKSRVRRSRATRRSRTAGSSSATKFTTSRNGRITIQAARSSRECTRGRIATAEFGDFHSKLAEKHMAPLLRRRAYRRLSAD